LATGTPQAATTNWLAVERRLDCQHLGAHGAGRPGDFLHGLAADPERHQEAADLGRRGIAGHHHVEGRFGLFAGKRLTARGDGEQRFEISRVAGHASPF
jgi:hypothetical protein